MGLRLFYLRAHYRSPLEYTEELVDAAGVAYDRLIRFLQRAPRTDGVPEDPAVMGRFVAAMEEDFATPQALAVAFEVLTEANRLLDAGADASGLVNAVHEIARVLGIGAEEDSLSDLAAEIEAIGLDLGVIAGEPVALLEALVSLRTAARAERDFERSDLVRDRLAAIGIVMEDGADGTRWIRR
jgi:cysteinyl-tRNA synthetase